MLPAPAPILRVIWEHTNFYGLVCICLWLSAMDAFRAVRPSKIEYEWEFGSICLLFFMHFIKRLIIARSEENAIARVCSPRRKCCQRFPWEARLQAFQAFLAVRLAHVSVLANSWQQSQILMGQLCDSCFHVPIRIWREREIRSSIGKIYRTVRGLMPAEGDAGCYLIGFWGSNLPELLCIFMRKGKRDRSKADRSSKELWWRWPSIPLQYLPSSCLAWTSLDSHVSLVMTRQKIPEGIHSPANTHLIPRDTLVFCQSLGY